MLNKIKKEEKKITSRMFKADYFYSNEGKYTVLANMELFSVV